MCIYSIWILVISGRSATRPNILRNAEAAATLFTSVREANTLVNGSWWQDLRYVGVVCHFVSAAGNILSNSQ